MNAEDLEEDKLQDSRLFAVKWWGSKSKLGPRLEMCGFQIEVQPKNIIRIPEPQTPGSTYRSINLNFKGS